MRDFYPERLTERYKIENFEELELYEILELIGKKARYDYAAAASSIPRELP